MKIKFPLLAAMFAISTLTACGGSDEPEVPVYSPPALVKTDILPLGTGAEATVGSTARVHYTAYLYTTQTPTNKGAQVDTSAGGTGYTLVVGATNVISGFSEGVTGMKVGGKRTVLVPAEKAYGSRGSSRVPPNSGMVFDLELLAVQPAPTTP